MTAKLDQRQVLLSVTKLIEKADIRAFELSMIATLGELISAESIRLCPIHENPEVPGQKLVAHTRPNESGSDYETIDTVVLESDKAFAECWRTEKKVVDRAGAGTGARVIHPIRGRGGVVGFLVVDCQKEDPKDQEVVSILLGFYKNYVSLLHDSQRDELTGLLNRKTFDEKILRIVASLRSARPTDDSREHYCLAVLDIDHFKRVNDKFGHLYGDEVLVLFARSMVEAFRGADLLFRTGGEEFVVVLKDVDLNLALGVLERFRRTIENSDFPQIGRITVSVGVSIIGANDLPASIIDRADQALYYAKNNGRNRVCAYERLVSEDKLKPAEEKNDIELF